MAARLTDKQKKKIVADYVQIGSYNAVARLNSVSKDTVRRIVNNCADIAQQTQQKKEQNTQEIITYMESQKDIVCEIIGKGLKVLPEKIQNAKSATEVTTAIGTLIDKFTGIQLTAGQPSDEDPLSRSLREFAEELNSD